MIKIDPHEFSREWLEAWNAHDLERVLKHFSEDFSITTPMIKVALGIDTGTISGKDNVREYWAAALVKIPDLKFELIEVTSSVNSIALYYKSVMGKMAIEVMYFNELGEVNEVVAHYTN
ncbi:MAG: nuclear transport factor 2 family protein [Colwellia sp.]|nr:nuclear transport factor 2 family protein [Colwellia sp.]